MTPIPLTAPDGTVYAYACGACRAVAGGSSYMVDRYSDDEVRSMAEFSLRSAERCCACRKCGGYLGSRYAGERNGHCVACWEGGERAAWEAYRAEWQARDEAYQRAREESLSRAKDSDAALELESLMSDISEHCYCAGWLIGTEDELWTRLAEGPGRWGMGEVSATEIAKLRELSERAGGWWHWPDEASGEIGPGRFFVPLDEWAAMAGGAA